MISKIINDAVTCYFFAKHLLDFTGGCQ